MCSSSLPHSVRTKHAHTKRGPAALLSGIVCTRRQAGQQAHALLSLRIPKKRPIVKDTCLRTETSRIQATRQHQQHISQGLPGTAWCQSFKSTLLLLKHHDGDLSSKVFHVPSSSSFAQGEHPRLAVLISEVLIRFSSGCLRMLCSLVLSSFLLFSLASNRIQ